MVFRVDECRAARRARRRVFADYVSDMLQKLKLRTDSEDSVDNSRARVS